MHLRTTHLIIPLLQKKEKKLQNLPLRAAIQGNFRYKAAIVSSKYRTLNKGQITYLCFDQYFFWCKFRRSIKAIDASSLLQVATTVQQEEQELRNLKGMLDTQGTLRPIFESHLRQKRSVRERAMQLRKIVAESGLDYNKVATIFTRTIPENNDKNGDNINEDNDQLEKMERVEIKSELKNRIPDANDEDLEELIELFEG